MVLRNQIDNHICVKIDLKHQLVKTNPGSIKIKTIFIINKNNFYDLDK